MDVTFEAVRFTRGGRHVIDVPSLRLRSGAITALLGPNGAGKTTLLRLIAGLEQPDMGRLLIGGGNPKGLPTVAYVFQENVFLRRSVVANVELPLLIRGRARSDARTRAMAALHLLGIESLADRQADRISAGEARRASLARALCLDAPLLLLDEPTAGLDGPTYARFLDELPALLRASRSTCVLVSHDAREALRLADDLVVLIDGSVLAAGPKHAVAENPERAAVARTLGYVVLDEHGGRCAIPDRSIQLGRGATEFSARVDAVLDIVFEWDVTVRIGDTLVHVPLLRSAIPPRPGDDVFVHALRAYTLSG